MSRVTVSDFKTLCETYYARKQAFIDNFSEGVSAEQKFYYAELYESFFEREVMGGLKSLEYFSEQLLNYLGKGRAITIELKGYSSPRASSRFNEIISSRRTLAFGESQSKKEVPDRLEDLKGSVFSIAASVERRVEIVKVSTRIAKPQ
jgi:hypothetical protein